MILKSIYIHTERPEDTFQVGAVIGQTLPAGSVVCLYGDLGAGKTKLTQGIGSGLGVKEPINSPTFTLINLYQGRLPLYHLDLYRLVEPEELEELGWEDYIYGEGIAVIEWPEKLHGQLPASYLKIRLDQMETATEEQRQLIIEGIGRAGSELMHLILANLAVLKNIKISTR
ncbi:MAG: tRNA (adenosine(37)-N6)-threonylcarbamoyltransferase complex ATPase subunit type 1 TsaE [Syntrophomonadaceae bacterium]|nr:tRNA (adenosine(37)-N6)-threonylcarbamoyltransferase complex ATPase subunit type 1 TsaE [Syntrophomonadaceae bacterium]